MWNVSAFLPGDVLLIECFLVRLEVVEDARQTFSTGKEAPLPPLPLPPATRTTNLSSSQTRSNRSSRLPRRILAANQIFSESGDQSTEMSSFVTSVYASPDTSTSPDNLNDSSALSVPQLQTPSRQRRATVSTRSPDPVVSGPIEPSFDIENGSPSKRKEKSKSHGNLFQLHIAPAATLGAELDKRKFRNKLVVSSITNNIGFRCERFVSML